MLFELDSDIAIRATDLGKCYQRYNKPIDRLKQAVFRKRHYFEEVWVLRDISFELQRGKALGVIGRNGAGKSTLLQILSGTLTPTTGEVYLRGKMAALLELGSGFNPEFSGRDNIYVNGAILGLSKKQIDERFDEIVAFSELGEYIEQPVKTYSSGMHVRLAFSVQVCVNPDILIVDEALAVGDVFFQQKCHARMEKLLDQGTSILLVSHDTSSIRKYCDTALFLEDGCNVFYGDVETAVSKFLFKKNKSFKVDEKTSKVSLNSLDKEMIKELTEVATSPCCADDVPVGSHHAWPEPAENVGVVLTGKEVVGEEGLVRFIELVLCGEDGLPREHFLQGEWAYFFWKIKLLQDFEVPVGGLLISTASNLPIFCQGILPSVERSNLKVLAGSVVEFRAAVKMDISVGDYVVGFSVAQMRLSDYTNLDLFSNSECANAMVAPVYLPKVLAFQVSERRLSKSMPPFGLVDLPKSLKMIIQKA